MLKKRYVPFLWMGFNCLKATELLWGGSLLFTTMFPEFLRMMKDWTGSHPVVLNTGTLPLSQNDRLVPGFLAKMKTLLIPAKYSGKIQKQPIEVFLWKRPATLLKRSLQHRCFLVNFVKFLTTAFSQNTSGWLF